MESKPLTLSQIRRIMIVIVACLLLVVSGMLGYVKYESTVEPDQLSTYVVTAFSEQVKPATELKQQLISQGLDVSVKSTKHKFEKPDGYRLVIRNSMDLLLPFKATLEYHKQPVKLVKDGPYLLYPKNFKEKKQAEKQAKVIQKKAGVAFSVEQNTKIVAKKALQFTVKDLNETDCGAVEEILNKNKFADVKVKEIPNAPQTEE